MIMKMSFTLKQDLDDKLVLKISAVAIQINAIKCLNGG